MGKDDILAQGIKAYRAGRYSRVVALLEPEILHHRDNGSFYRLLGCACYMTGDYGGADTYLQRSSQIRDREPEVLTLLAQIQIRRRQGDKALKLLLDALELDPGFLPAKKTLEGLRKNAGEDKLQQWITSPGFRKLMPRMYGSAVFERSLPFLVGGVLGLTLTFTWSLWVPALGALVFPPTGVQREGSKALDPKSLGEFTSFEGNFRLILTPGQIRDTMKKAQDYFNKYQDNLARVEINRLLASNATADIKGRCQTLAPLLKSPDFSTYKDDFTYSQVRSSPWLYDQVIVRWTGKVANKQIHPDKITFDFLVGYDSNQVLEGIVPVTLGFAALFENGDPLDLLAKVQINQNSFTLVGTGLHKMVP